MAVAVPGRGLPVGPATSVEMIDGYSFHRVPAVREGHLEQGELLEDFPVVALLEGRVLEAVVDARAPEGGVEVRFRVAAVALDGWVLA